MIYEEDYLKSRPASRPLTIIVNKIIFAFDNSIEMSSGAKHTFARQGVLNKKGRGLIIKSWKTRRFVLRIDFKLNYYDEDDLIGSLILSGANVRSLSPMEADGRLHCFEIYDLAQLNFKSKNLILQASTSAEAADWITSIQNCIEASNQLSSLPLATKEVVAYDCTQNSYILFSYFLIFFPSMLADDDEREGESRPAVKGINA